ncbi:hypothetical protein GZ78_25650 [Endozoicomonas numazuensis]|uniref:Uncharacterized protein n=1 Tax=Endozoicomonas numazuensis TaxID=1137799 RepID=A0A081N6F4_9GAMM|nr:hypothetical protein GZ78_25650 [Endozoicomonas numazuensis]
MQGCEGAKSVDIGKPVGWVDPSIPASFPPRLLSPMSMTASPAARAVGDFSVSKTLLPPEFFN